MLCSAKHVESMCWKAGWTCDKVHGSSINFDLYVTSLSFLLYIVCIRINYVCDPLDRDICQNREERVVLEGSQGMAAPYVADVCGYVRAAVTRI